MTELKNKTVKTYPLSPARSFLPEEDIQVSEYLLPEQVQMINEALYSLGEFGEVRLIVEKGRLRYLVTQKSMDVFKWQPGTLIRDLE